MAERSARTRAILTGPCPSCGAPPGRMCRVITGRAGRLGHIAGRPHQARQDAAMCADCRDGCCGRARCEPDGDCICPCSTF